MPSLRRPRHARRAALAALTIGLAATTVTAQNAAADASSSPAPDSSYGHATGPASLKAVGDLRPLATYPDGSFNAITPARFYDSRTEGARTKLAANETRGIPAPLLSRLSVHRIAPPPASAFDETLAGLSRAVAEDMGCTAADLPVLEPETLDALRRSFTRHRNLRRLRAQLEECLGLAAEQALSASH